MDITSQQKNISVQSLTNLTTRTFQEHSCAKSESKGLLSKRNKLHNKCSYLGSNVAESDKASVYPKAIICH